MLACVSVCGDCGEFNYPPFDKQKKENRQLGDGWEDGTPPPHRDFKERRVVLAVTHPRAPFDLENASRKPLHFEF